MIKPNTPNFEIPSEMRAVAEKSVEQAKAAFNNFIQAAQQAAAAFEEQVKASQTGAQDVSRKAMSYAEHNVATAFDFAQKVLQARDVQEVIRMQTEFVQAQMQALSEQAKDLGEIATRAAMDSVKTGSGKGVS